MTAMVLPKKLPLILLPRACVTQTAGQRAFLILAFGNRVRVRLLDDLNLVLYLPEKAIRVAELCAIPRRNKLVLRKLRQRSQRIGLAYARFIASIDQLHGLGEKFYLANAAVAKLEVSFLAVGGQEFIFDAHLHVPQLIHGRIIEVSPVDERLNFLQKLSPKFPISGYCSSLD